MMPIVADVLPLPRLILLLLADELTMLPAAMRSATECRSHGRRTLVSAFADRILAGMTMGNSTRATRLQSLNELLYVLCSDR